MSQVRGPEGGGGPEKQRGAPGFRWTWLYWLLALGLLIGFSFASGLFSQPSQNVIAYSDFVTQVEKGNVKTALFNGAQISGAFSKAVGGQAQYTAQEPAQGDPALIQLLLQHKVKVTAAASGFDWSGVINIVVSLLFLVFIGSLLWQARRGGRIGIGGVAQTKARMYSEERPKVSFADVASNEEAKLDLHEVIDYLKAPEQFAKVGARVPRGVLLVGAPGTGKTLMARAVAGEANVPFFSVSATEFVEMFVGVGAARIRDLFEKAKAVAPSIVFVDEIDAIGRERGGRAALVSNDEREQTLNQLLVEMDGFEPNQGVIVLAATNRPDILDPALLRPGRFDRRIELQLPDRVGRLAILKLYGAKVPLAPACDLEGLSRRTPGFSGADLSNLVNEAALAAARARRAEVLPQDLEEAFDKVLLGARRTLAMDEAERRRVAVHEAGHALVAHFLPDADPLERVSVVAHGRSLGATQFAPLEERMNLSEAYLKAQLAVALGGREGERLLTGDISSGAENDLRQATGFVRSMVTKWGMSPRLGPIASASGERDPWSELRGGKLSDLADEEMMRILGEAEQVARGVLAKHRSQLEALSSLLLEHETLDRSQVEAIAGPRPLPAAASPGDRLVAVTPAGR